MHTIVRSQAILNGTSEGKSNMKTTKEKIEVMQAGEDGSIIEAKRNVGEEDRASLRYVNWSEDVTGNGLSYNWTLYDYRIKPAQTLKERIEAEYGDYRVEMLEYDNDGILEMTEDPLNCISHTVAQSMKGFHKYVYDGYEGSDDRSFYSQRTPTGELRGKTRQPVACLFYKQEEEK